LTGSLNLLFYASEVHLVCKSLEVTEALAVEIKTKALSQFMKGAG